MGLIVKGVEALAGTEPNGEEPVTGYGFSLDRPLPPEHVITCRHSRGLPDHLV